MIAAEALAEGLGILAGGILLYSGAPVLFAQLQRSDAGTPQERQSRLAMAVGNFLWVLAGILSGLWSVAAMCSLNAAIQSLIWIRMTRATRQ